MPRASGSEPLGSKSSECRSSEGSGSSKAGGSSSNAKTEAKQMELRVAIYRPEEGTYYHWAFIAYIMDTIGFHLFEVISQNWEPFRYTYRQTNPESSTRHQVSIPLATVSQDWLGTVTSTAQGIPLPRERNAWNCQDYIMELWKGMYQNGVVGHDIYTEGCSRLMPYFGPEFGSGANGDAK